MVADLKERSLPTHGQANGPQGDSKLELFGFDSLVNILGLRRSITVLFPIVSKFTLSLSSLMLRLSLYIAV